MHKQKHAPKTHTLNKTRQTNKQTNKQINKQKKHCNKNKDNVYYKYPRL